MPYNGNRRRGIAGIPGRNLNSVRGSLDISGLYPVRMWHGGTPHVEEGAGDRGEYGIGLSDKFLSNYADSVADNQNAPRSAEARIQDQVNLYAKGAPSASATEEDIQNRYNFIKSYLGDSGYDQERDKDKSNAKLQAALALAQAGFGLMGAQPGEGESPMSVAGRAFGAPLAGRMSEIAGTFSERDAARRAAQRSEERQIKLQAFQDAEAKQLALRESYLASRAKGIEGAKEGIDFLEDQEQWNPQTGQWEVVGRVKRVMTGLLKDIPVYTDGAGKPLTGKLRNFKDIKLGHKPATTLMQDQERIVGEGEAENVAVWSYLSFNSDGTPGEPQTFFADTGERAYYSDREVEGVTIPANARHPEKATEAHKPFAPSTRTYTLTAEGRASLVSAGFDIPEELIGTFIQVDQQRPSVAGEKSHDILRIGSVTIDSRDLTKSGLTQSQLATLYKEVETSEAGATDDRYETPTHGDFILTKEGATLLQLPEEFAGKVISVDSHRPKGQFVGDTEVPSFDVIRVGPYTVNTKDSEFSNEQLASIYEAVGKDEAEVNRIVAKENRQYDGALSSLQDYRQEGDISREGENSLDYGINGFTYQGTLLNEAAQDKVKNYFRDIYDNTMGTLTVGMGVEKTQDKTKTFAAQFYRTPITDILSPEEIIGVGEASIPLDVAPQTVPSVVRQGVTYRPYSREFSVVKQAYENLGADFAANAALPKPDTTWNVLGGGEPLVPLPNHARLTANPNGRLALMSHFIPSIWSNPATQSDSRLFENNEAAREAALNRAVAEQIAADPSVSSGAADLADRNASLMAELGKRKEKLRVLINSPVSREIKNSAVQTIKMLEVANDLESALLRISATGFISGPITELLAKIGITDAPLTDSIDLILSGENELSLDERDVARLYRNFLVQKEILNELGGRALLKETGDLRYSDKDMAGARKVLIKMNQTGNMNIARMQELKKFLLNGLNSNMGGLGTLGLQDDVVIRAIKSGAKVSGVRPSKNGAYSPFAPESYVVSKNKQPGYRRNDIEKWRLEGLLKPAMRDGSYLLPSRKGEAPGKNPMMIPEDEIFALDKDNRFVYGEYIKNYEFWENQIRKKRNLQ